MCRRSGRPLPGADDLGLFHDLRMLEAVVWICCMAHLFPARHGEQARERLAAMLPE